MHYADKRDAQKAWIEFDIGSILDVLYKRSIYACFFEIHTNRSERLPIRNYVITEEFKTDIRTKQCSLEPEWNSQGTEFSHRRRSG